MVNGMLNFPILHRMYCVIFLQCHFSERVFEQLILITANKGQGFLKQKHIKIWIPTKFEYFKLDWLWREFVMKKITPARLGSSMGPSLNDVRQVGGGAHRAISVKTVHQLITNDHQNCGLWVN